MQLFADGDNSGTWLGLIAVIATGIIGLVTGWMNKKYDAKVLALQNQNDNQQKDINRLTQDHTDCIEEHKDTRKQLAETKEKLDDCNEKHQQTAEVQSHQRADLDKNTKTIESLKSDVEKIKQQTGIKT